ncbi:MAG: FtsW/RodA/SpoVE family cell cycle protein [Coriobacteriia bacterium]|nr:FtsW/RodA/SpoVE family cell cycle protein [Coriobacteriia bacterium]
MTRRNLELVLLIIASPLAILLFAMLALSQGETLGWNAVAVPVCLFAAFILAHLAVRKFTPNADPALLPIAFALSGIGLAFVTRLAPDLATRQVVWLFLSIAAMVVIVAFVKNIDRSANFKYTLMLVGVLLLLSPLLPVVGTEIYGSKIWLSVAGISFQPGELAKILIVLFLAGYLAQNRELLSVFTVRIGPVRLPDVSVLIPLLLMWGIAMAVAIFEKDLGSALVLFFVFIIMLYIASGRKVYLVVALVLAVMAGVILYIFFSHVQVRVATWLDPFADAQDTGYQLTQAIFSMADGDLLGLGIGNGMADQIPIVESDFIFASIAEEMGLLGGAGLLLLYLCFAIRSFTVAARAKTDVSCFIAAGLTAIVVLQAFIIVGGVTRLIPLTGLALPFVAQGGSSLLSNFIIVGLLLHCSNESTGVNEEMATTTSLHSNSTLGRVAVGKRLTGTIWVFAIMIAALVANLTYIMVVNAETYQNMPSNNHTIAREANSKRGSISTYDGVVLAESTDNGDGSFSRTYPAGTMAAHVVGYYSTQYGTAGIEAACNDILKGQRNFATWSDVLASATGTTASGNDVTLTINSKIQQAAQAALEGETGACVVIDPSTGAVLALASSPTYNAADFEALLDTSTNGSSGSSMYNRATSALYAPGSTFKMVSLAAALENNVADENSTFDSPGTMEIGNADVTNFGKYDYGTITLARATELSSNTVYGQLGVQIGAQTLVRTAEAFMFNKSIDFELPVTTSLMPDPAEMTTWETAWAAAGEPVGEHTSPAGPQASVLEMALVGCAIANNGTLMKPYLLQSVHNAQGELSYTASGSVLARPISQSTAERVRKVLEGVVNNGTGTAVALSGVQIAGKTGTAESPAGDDSWFVGMAPSNGSTVVVALALEKSENAAGKARSVFETALTVQGIL